MQRGGGRRLSARALPNAQRVMAGGVVVGMVADGVEGACVVRIACSGCCCASCNAALIQPTVAPLLLARSYIPCRWRDLWSNCSKFISTSLAMTAHALNNAQTAKGAAKRTVKQSFIQAVTH